MEEARAAGPMQFAVIRNLLSPSPDAGIWQEDPGPGPRTLPRGRLGWWALRVMGRKGWVWLAEPQADSAPSWCPMEKIRMVHRTR